MSMRHRGFTLIELLIVIAIVGLLTTLSVAVFGTSKSKSRDTQRVANARSIQTALELAYTENSSYPMTNDTDGLGPDASAILGNATSTVLCRVGNAAAWTSTRSGCGGGTIYLNEVPDDLTPPIGEVYRYAGTASSYQITFNLEIGTGQLKAGAVCANQNGMQSGTAC